MWNSVAQREVVTIDNIKAWDGDSGKFGAIDNIGANCGLQRSIVVIINNISNDSNDMKQIPITMMRNKNKSGRWSMIQSYLGFSTHKLPEFNR